MKRIFNATQQFLLITIFALFFANVANAQSTLPAYTDYKTPIPMPAAPGESFNAPMSGKPADKTPAFAEFTRTAGPDESIIITGADFTRFSGADEAKDSRFKVFGSNTFYIDASIQRLEKNKAVLTLGKDIPKWSMYLVWPGNGAGYGKPFAVNKTDAWWVGPAKAEKGTSVSVYGRNLAQYNDSTVSNVYLKPSNSTGQWAKVVKVNPYKVEFQIPSNIANGEYEVWTHNGHGGQYGWSGPLKLTINEGQKWTKSVFNVKDFGALGNGQKDDTEAIYRALSEAKKSAGSTVYFPKGTYMISNMLNPSDNTQWKGDGKELTFIKCNSKFTSQADAMVYGSVNTFNLSDITFDTNNNFRAIHAAPFFLRGSSNVRVDNVVLSFANYDVMQLDNTNGMFFTNCKFIGKISFLGKASQLFIDKSAFYLTNDTENALHSWAGTNISITNSTCQDYNNSDPNNGAGWGKGRFFCATGNFGSGGSTYIGNNATYDLSVRENDAVDQNSGEQFLWEGFSAKWSGSVTSSTLTSTKLSGFSLSVDEPKIAVITKGTGLGQSRRIISANGSAITLDAPWNLAPDETSIIAVGHFADRIVMYKNYIDGKAYAASSPNFTASSGIQPYGGVFNFIADQNTISEVRAGIANWSTQHSFGIDPNYFSLYANNEINGCRWAIQNGLDMNRSVETALLGSMFRKNNINTTLQSGIVNTIMRTSTPVLENFVYEHNEFTNVRTAFSTGGDVGLPNGFSSSGDGIATQIFYKNNFSSGSGLAAIAVTKRMALRENTFSGFSVDYSGSLPEPSVEAPLHVIEISGVAGKIQKVPFSIWNSGIKSIAWKASTDANWLGFSDTTGVIDNQRSSSKIDLVANATGLSAGNYTSAITIKEGNSVKKFTVVFTVEAASVPLIALSSPTVGSSFTSAAAIDIAANASDKNEAISKVEFYEGTTKIGEDLIGPYTFSWTNSKAGTYKLSAKVTNSAGVSSTSAPVEILVTDQIVPVAPIIAITIPENTSSLLAPSSINILADASDKDGTIAKVEFFAGSEKLGEDITSPFVFAWNNIEQGRYNITAKATDNSGLTAISSELEITVYAPVIASVPQVNITSPVSKATFTALAATTITATATNAEGEIIKVEFFAGNKKLGEDSTKPYSVFWNNITSGTYELTARATNNAGISTISDKVEIIVNNPVITSNSYNYTAYPNPFKQLVTIAFNGVAKENAVLQIYNLRGVLLETLYKGGVDTDGSYSFQFDGTKYPSGLYLARLVSGKTAMAKLLMLTK